ncbi:hypothetical protein [Clavibacter michiganensis]|uniref:Uncharacterized protein n=1 Tax=Clavibacter michiganensis subsp. insidiosus TaxID=33014 RepID=A0A0D5CHA0_9MICO|nr:hypothetical protein [Clavibacter michiganensis]AJW79011.1 hypothetical protein VO01_07610 [Clavibacter michiganensis subsp. insidiosus]AWF98297.1 hypothetical protein BEH61_07235 [Clavibacter michiganensis subsp. insidiosus]AWG01501.1 hypothetical protein BEH62_07835 [Clavibacter michiganensis subsp. insidiosus]OQJ59968.1 hypothetical protein B5P21_08625 [Clavibacter michiganensis subsp. insidiosus]RII88929.1 hypothetical protein DZF92_01055 [Clavibacter michiganensis subsp. insidiosus]
MEYVLTDDLVARIRIDSLTVSYGGRLLTVRASEHLSPPGLVRQRAVLEVVAFDAPDEVLVYICPDSGEQHAFWSARMFGAGVLGEISRTLSGGLQGTLR